MSKLSTIDLNPYIQMMDLLCAMDEPERALKVPSLLPGYCRDFPPESITNMVALIKSKLITAHGYMNDAYDSHIHEDYESAKQIVAKTLRGQLMQAEVKQASYPHIVDVGPGEYWLCMGLLGPFTYQDIAMDTRTQSSARANKLFQSRQKIFDPTSTQTRIFSAMEIIEHISNPDELAWEANRAFKGLPPHYIHLSTPEYAYDHHEDWKQTALPHLRTYTPKEFYDTCGQIFPGYSWTLYKNPMTGTPFVMSIRGVHSTAPNKEPLKISMDPIQ